MNLEDRLRGLRDRRVDDDLPVESTWSEQGAVQDLGSIGRRQQDDTGVGFEAIHLHQQLVEGLLPLVVDGAQMDATLAADRVEFVNEDEAGGLGLGLLEQVTDPAAPTPTNISTNSLPLSSKKGTRPRRRRHAPGASCRSRADPSRRTPFGIFAPNAW